MAVETRPTETPERVEPERPPHYVVLRCGRCGNGLARVWLLPGCYVEVRCHHTIRLEGKRQTCGWLNTGRPTR